jgi:hypothetical protein
MEDNNNDIIAGVEKKSGGLDEPIKEELTKEEAIAQGKPWFNKETGRWEGYKPQKGVTPPWNPFSQEGRKNRITMKERKFMMMVSTTGSLHDAYKATYKVKEYPNKKIESARIGALANQVLRRIRNKAPELVAAMTFEDITPDFVKKEMLKLYNQEDASIHEKTRLLELMGKTQAMFTDKIQSDTKIRGMVDTIYKETDEDFPEKDERIGRLEIEDLNKIGIS